MLILTMLTTACSKGHFDALPDVVGYTKETQIKAAKELQENDVPVLLEFMKDYKVMRDQVRVARK